MSLIIEDDGGVQTFLDQSFVVPELEQEAPDTLQAAALQHGGRDVSSGMFQSGHLSLIGMLYGENRQDYETKKNDLLRILNRPNNKLYPEYPPDKFLKLRRMNKFKQTFVSGAQFRIAQVDLSFVLEDPFWQDVNQITDGRTLVNGSTVTLYNPGTVVSPAVVTLVGLSTGPTLFFRNTDDSNQVMIYSDLALTSGNTVVIDGVEGTVLRGNVNTSRFLSGSFMQLVPGANRITYAGDTIYWSMACRPRYL